MPQPPPPVAATPVVSMIVPCWNAAATIRRAVASILEVRDVELECIVVDDASSDATLAIARSIAADDPRVRVLALPENRGVSNARNAALEVAQGTWLGFLDADDRFYPGGLATLVNAATSGDALAVIGQQVWSNGRRTWIGPLYDNPDIRRPGRKSVATSPGLLYYASPHAKLFHRSVAADLRFEGRALGDQPWIIRALIRAGDRIDVLGETVYEWIRTPPAGSGPSITTATRASASKGAEAAAVATLAFDAVRSETEASITDAAGQRLVQTAYVARLLRSDLAFHLSGAIARRDPAAAELLVAIGRFVAGLPVDAVRGSPALARDILEPLLTGWLRLPPDARDAARELVRQVFAIDPQVAARGSNPLARLGLRLFESSDSGALRRRLALGLVMVSRLPSEARRVGGAVARRVARRIEPRPA